MDFNKLTLKSQEAVAAAQELARRLGNPELYPEHLLIALLDQDLPQRLVPDAASLRAQAEATIRSKPSIQGAQQQPTVSAPFSRLLDKAADEARRMEDDYVSTEHLLLALDVVPRDQLEAKIKSVRGGQRVTSQDPEETYQALEKFGRDLTAAAEDGKLDPVIGRDEEIRRVIQVLSRRTKNNPVLIGDPGVGKTAIAEGLAQRIVAGDVPEGLKGKRVWALDVGEPSVADTIAILRGLKERYEAHHGVRIRDAALVAAAVLSDRYITDRFLPDKAIDLVDEAASRLRMEIDSSPVELDEADRRVRQLEIELAATAKESRDVKEPVERELAEAKERRNELQARWDEEKEALDRVKEITQQIDALRKEYERAERAGDFTRAAEIRHGELPQLERELDERAMVRLDMSEYQERHTVARLIGAPPGYVGYEEGGQLTEAVRRRPYSVILLDEIEKAHNEVFDVLLQILDDGRLTDGHGRTVDFRNTVLIMTSNLRSVDQMREFFRPEFLNRIDEIVEFKPLTKEQLGEIVERQVARLRARLADRGIELELTDEAKQVVADAGWDPTYGARPLKRALQRMVENPLALRLLEGEFSDGDTVRVDARDGELVFERSGAREPAVA